MERDTKERIIAEALRLFSQKGYAATSVHAIAKAVGVKTASLYNHFMNKQEIFDTIVARMAEKFSIAFSGASVPEGDAAAQVKMYAEGGMPLLKAAALHLFHYHLTDPEASRFGNLLSIEKHINPEIDLLHTQAYIDGPLAYEAGIFAEMIHEGYMITADPEIMALQFFAPMFLLLDKYKNTPERETEALDMLDRHIEQFCRVYDRK